MAKDYRELKRLQMHEWEKDEEWMGKRLSFLWYVRDYQTDLYKSLSLVDEKNDFYKLDSSNVNDLALKDYQSVDRTMYDNIYRNIIKDEMIKEYKMLEIMKEENFRKFLIKKNCNKFEYFRMLIAEGSLRIDE